MHHLGLRAPLEAARSESARKHRGERAGEADTFVKDELAREGSEESACWLEELREEQTDADESPEAERGKGLEDPEAGDWHHGFNSGALAVLRFIETALRDGINNAHESFPELDT